MIILIFTIQDSKMGRSSMCDGYFHLSNTGRYRWQASQAHWHLKPTRRIVWPWMWLTFNWCVLPQFFMHHRLWLISGFLFNLVFVALAACITVGLGVEPWWMFFQCFFGFTLFYCAHWQTYVSGIWSFHLTNSTDINLNFYWIRYTEIW